MALDIRLSKADLAEKIKRRLGYPVIKVELSTQQLYDCIDYARDKWIKWAVGQAHVETYFTLLLRAGQKFYDLPIGVYDIATFDDTGSEYGINTLFTVDNFLYSKGVLDALVWTKDYAYSLVSYHLARDYLKTIKKYTPSIYSYQYHPYTNQMECRPAPPSGNALVINEDGVQVTVDSPGFILLRAYMFEGSQYSISDTTLSSSTWKRNSSDEHFYISPWIFDYALAESKIVLGRIRSKFAQFTSIGNIGIALDGDALLQEGMQEKEKLEETLRLEEGYEGYGILIG